MGNENITNLADLDADLDAVNKAYVDELLLQIEELQLQTGIRIEDMMKIYKTISIGTQVWMRI